jgi:hypothetical protein
LRVAASDFKVDLVARVVIVHPLPRHRKTFDSR